MLEEASRSTLKSEEVPGVVINLPFLYWSEVTIIDHCY